MVDTGTGGQYVAWDLSDKLTANGAVAGGTRWDQTRYELHFSIFKHLLH